MNELNLANGHSIRCVQAFTGHSFFLPLPSIKSGYIRSSEGYYFRKCDFVNSVAYRHNKAYYQYKLVIIQNRSFIHQFYSKKKSYFIVLPAAGYRDSGNSSSGNLASFGSYWSSTLNASGKSSYLFFGSSNAGTALYSLASSLSVRCVQAFTSHSFVFTCSFLSKSICARCILMGLVYV